MNVAFSDSFLRHYSALEPRVKRAFEKKFIVFIYNSLHPSLNNHQLSGKFSKYRSINIVGDWRAVYRKSSNQKVTFEVIGKKKELFKKR